MSVRRRLTRIRLDKIAGVDAPCQQFATVAIVKRAPAPLAIAKATFQEALDAAQLSSAVNRAFYDSFDGLWERNDAFREALTDELASGGDGSKASDDYVASVQALVERAVSAAQDAGSEEADAIEKVLFDAAAEWLVEKSSPEETKMKITTKAALMAAVAAFDPAKSTVADADSIRKAATDLGAEDALPIEGPLAKAKPDPQVAKLSTEIAILKLAPEAKSYFDGLDEAGQTAFLAKSKADQDSDVAKANETDPVVYKCKDGTEIRKSDGAVAASQAKRLDDQAEEIAKLRGETKSTSFEKRAVEEFPKVAKDVAVSMLKSADQIGIDTEAGKGIIASLTTMNKSAEPAFQRLGSSGAERVVPQGIAKARSTFASKADEIAKRDSIGKAAAMEKAEIENPELFAEAYPESEPADARETAGE